MYLNNNYMTGAVLKDMPNNSGNFTDGAASEQHQPVSYTHLDVYKRQDGKGQEPGGSAQADQQGRC